VPQTNFDFLTGVEGLPECAEKVGHGDRSRRVE
jgi:hypothetical protein